MVETTTLDQAESGVGESGHADRAVYHAFPKQAHEGVLIQSASLTAGSPRFRAVVADVTQRLERTPGVQQLTGPHTNHGANVSPDGHSPLVTFEIPGDGAEVQEAVDAPVAAIAAAATAHPGFDVEAFGDASTGKELMEVIDGDLRKAGLISLPLTLAILLLAFGGLMVAGAPVVLALSAVFATIGIVGPISRLARQPRPKRRHGHRADGGRRLR